MAIDGPLSAVYISQLPGNQCKTLADAMPRVILSAYREEVRTINSEYEDAKAEGRQKDDEHGYQLQRTANVMMYLHTHWMLCSRLNAHMYSRTVDALMVSVVLVLCKNYVIDSYDQRGRVGRTLNLGSRGPEFNTHPSMRWTGFATGCKL